MVEYVGLVSTKKEHPWFVGFLVSFCFVFAIIWKFLPFVLKAILDKLKDLLTQKEVILLQKFGPLLF